MLLLGLYLAIKGFKDDGEPTLGVILMVVSAMPIIILVSVGCRVYPELLSLKKEIEILKMREKEIKECYYKGNDLKNVLMNLQQSTNWAQYLIKVVEKEAEFKKKLAKAKFYRKSIFHCLFGCGQFISPKIFELEEDI